MRIGIIGSGALGLYYGAMLARAANDVRFLLRRDLEAIRRGGLRVRSTGGDFHLAEVAGFATPEEMGEVDLVLVGLKTFANGEIGRLAGPLVGPGTLVLTLQNGLGNEELLASLFGPERVLGGVAFLCANRGEPGEVRHLGEGRITLGSLVPENSGRAEEVAETFRRAGLACRAVDDLVRAKWEKLVWNIPFNGTSALLGQPVDALLRHPRVRDAIAGMMAEVIAAANAQGLSADIPPSFADSMIRMTEGMGPYRPSMLIDREEGRPLELEAIYGIPLERGAGAGVNMPLVSELYAFLDWGEAASAGRAM